MDGGKTHTLVGLYHIFKNSEEILKNNAITNILNDLNFLTIPEVSLVAMDCRSLSSTGVDVDTKTLWGEIGKQLGCYNLIKEYDQSLRRPPTELLDEMLKSLDKPVLILMDELVNYLKDAQGEKIGDTNLANITIAFLHNITEVVSNTEKAMIILTLPGNEPSYKEEAELLEEFKESVRSIIAR